ELTLEDLRGSPERPVLRHYALPHPEMGRMRWPVPEIATIGDLAAFLGLEPGTLMWLADPRGLERVAGVEPLRNYRYLQVPRRTGSPRVIEAPKARLKAAQRRVLHEIL